MVLSTHEYTGNGVNPNVTPEPEVVDLIEHPKHYTSHPAGVECIEIIQEFPYSVGAAIKHLWRAGLKQGNPPLQDLRKAKKYVEFEIKRLERTLKE